MKTVTLSTRLSTTEADRIDRLAAELGLDRSSLLKQLVRRGYHDLQTAHVLDDYRRGLLTLSRAAELAGIGVRDILARLPQESVELNYDLPELQRDLDNLPDASCR